MGIVTQRKELLEGSLETVGSMQQEALFTSCKLGPSEIREVIRELKLVKPLNSNLRCSSSIGTFSQERM